MREKFYVIHNKTQNQLILYKKNNYLAYVDLTKLYSLFRDDFGLKFEFSDILLLAISAIQANGRKLDNDWVDTTVLFSMFGLRASNSASQNRR
jgi:hypothetical protein